MDSLSFRLQSYYKILGVSKNSTPKEIKAKFYERAKNLHPDTNNSKNLRESHEEFIRLKEAYDYLMNVSNKKEEIGQSETGRTRNSGTNYSYNIENEQDFFSSNRRRKPRASITKSAQNSWNTFRLELDQALHSVLHGSETILKGEFPEQMELEERDTICNLSKDSSISNTAEGEEIVQIVHGRCLLGSVIYSHKCILPANVNDNDAKRDFDPLTIFGNDFFPTTLTLRWDGKAYAKATKTKNIDTPGLYSICFEKLSSDDSGDSNEEKAPYTLEYLTKTLWYEQHVLKNSDGIETHRIVR